MSYKAIIAKAVLRKHPNADRLKLVDLNGYQVVTGADLTEGQLVAFFPEGGCLSHEFVYENSEYRQGKGENKDQSSQGLFESNRRIKTIKLRGEKSEGYCVPLDSLAFTGVHARELTEGTTFTELNGHPICEKYVAPATREAMDKASRAGRAYFAVDNFEKHFDTEQLRMFVNRIPVGAVLYFTEKLHGTSGRTGRMLIQTKIILNWWKNLAFKALHLLENLVYDRQVEPSWPSISDWKVVTGSRNMTFNPDSAYADSYRKVVENWFIGKLNEGETVFYEIVGFTEGGNALFKHPVGGDPKDDVRKELAKIYGPTMIYSYGCDKAATVPFNIYVYRITSTDSKGNAVEYSWSQVIRRCRELGQPVVPTVAEPIVYDGNKEALLQKVATLASGVSSIDKSHIREGICLRVEHPDVPVSRSILKYKGFEFCHLEGIAKNDDSYVDAEEVS